MTEGHGTQVTVYMAGISPQVNKPQMLHITCVILSSDDVVCMDEGTQLAGGSVARPDASVRMGLG